MYISICNNQGRPYTFRGSRRTRNTGALSIFFIIFGTKYLRIYSVPIYKHIFFLLVLTSLS